MRVHHLNCMTFRLGVRSITHCLLVETADGLVLVDAGLGLGDYEQPTRKMRAFLALNRVPRKPEETAIRQVVSLGYSPEDVQHIVLTYLHLDHSGGLPDFPWARVHVFAAEYQAAMQQRQKGLLNWFGYETVHCAYGPRWVRYELGGEEWFGLPCAEVQGIESARLVLVPLIGHTPGHCGVAVEVEGGYCIAAMRTCEICK
jgi:glyoxylase-like metal-dependent hydrolase (beta-lactamase superfamily II)